MKRAIAYALMGAAAVLTASVAALAIGIARLARRIEEEGADDSEVVGMPTTWDGQLLHALGLDPANYTVEWRTDPLLPRTVEMREDRIDWDHFFATHRRDN